MANLQDEMPNLTSLKTIQDIDSLLDVIPYATGLYKLSDDGNYLHLFFNKAF